MKAQCAAISSEQSKEEEKENKEIQKSPNLNDLDSLRRYLSSLQDKARNLGLDLSPALPLPPHHPHPSPSPSPSPLPPPSVSSSSIRYPRTSYTQGESYSTAVSFVHPSDLQSTSGSSLLTSRINQPLLSNANILNKPLDRRCFPSICSSPAPPSLPVPALRREVVGVVRSQMPVSISSTFIDPVSVPVRSRAGPKRTLTSTASTRTREPIVEKWIIVRRWGASRGGTKLKLPPSLPELLKISGEILGISVCKVREYSTEAEIKFNECLSHNDVVFVTTQEEEIMYFQNI
eukprot:TRINITY_DN4565_c0_g1_i1.p1 TRINITY_DN4565_c0_g1~~TRINITY_DN4565_c0_g1_i1.p1  ORF type:complete len:303 (+),score=67.98 TRINITY_DN4565_c0_g1_i1:41-910(+)